MASTRTRPFSSASTLNPPSTELANDSSTALRSAGLSLMARYFRFLSMSKTFGPIRRKETILPSPSCPRSSPTGLEPSPEASAT